MLAQCHPLKILLLLLLLLVKTTSTRQAHDFFQRGFICNCYKLLLYREGNSSPVYIWLIYAFCHFIVGVNIYHNNNT